MALILDMNALSGAADPEPSALEIVARAERLAVPVIVLGEYRLGIAQSRHRASYENWLREWISCVKVLDIDLGLRVEENVGGTVRQSKCRLWELACPSF